MILAITSLISAIAFANPQVVRAPIAGWKISELRPPQHLRLVPEITLVQTRLADGTRLVLLSKIDLTTIGYAIVETQSGAGTEIQTSARMLIHENQNLIVPGDLAQAIDFSSYNPLLIGNDALIFRGGTGVSSRYKPVAWFGPFFGDGHGLLAKEKLVDLTTQAQYGVSNSVTLGSYLALDPVAPNLSLKYTLIDNGAIMVTPSVYGLYGVSSQQFAGSMRILYSTRVNSKFVSHTIVSYAAVPDTLASQLRFASVLFRSQFITGMEYIRDNWDRVFFSPLFDATMGTVGFYAAYLWVWDVFNFSAGFQTQNVLNLSFDPKAAYTTNLAMYWRW